MRSDIFLLSSCVQISSVCAVNIKNMENLCSDKLFNNYFIDILKDNC